MKKFKKKNKPNEAINHTQQMDLIIHYNASERKLREH